MLVCSGLMMLGTKLVVMMVASNVAQIIDVAV